MESSQRGKGIVSNIFGMREMGTLLVLIFICVVLALTQPSFSNRDNLLSLTRSFSLVAIMAVGETLIILTGGIDLSVGSIFGLAGIIAAKQAASGNPIGIAYLLAICAGAAFGFANGFLVTAGRIPSFIATLGTLSVGRTAIYLLTGGWPVSGLLAPFVFSGDMRNNGPIIVMVVLTIAGIIVLTKTGFGRRVYAIGGNETAARLSGVNVNRTKLAVYIITGALCALAGVLNAAVLGVGDPEGGKGYELDVIAASVIGGTSLAGGRGSIFGAFLGAAIMGVIRNGLVLMNVQSDRHPGVIGLVIIVAVLFDTWRRRSKGAFQE